MIHPPCDAVRVHLARLRTEELFAQVARQRRTQQLHVPSISGRAVASLVSALWQIARLPAVIAGTRFRRDNSRVAFAPDKRSVRA